MNLRSSVKKMKSLLKVSKENRDFKWAHDLCTTSRWIHVGVWRECPESRYVLREVLKVMQDAKKELLELNNTKRFSKAEKKDITQFAKNDTMRISNIKKCYLRGKPSAFAPDHKISEPVHNVG